MKIGNRNYLKSVVWRQGLAFFGFFLATKLIFAEVKPIKGFSLADARGVSVRGDLGPVLFYDLNFDGFPEVVLPARNWRINNLGQLRFKKGTLLLHPLEGIGGARMADFNRDGLPDILVCAQEGATHQFYIYFADADGLFFYEPVALKLFTDEPTRFRVLDANGDGNLDLLYYLKASVDKDPVLQLGQSDGRFKSANKEELMAALKVLGPAKLREVFLKRHRKALESNAGEQFVAAYTEDLDADGQFDLVVHTRGVSKDEPGRLYFLQNRNPRNANWMGLQLIALPWVNPVDATIRVRTWSGTQTTSVHWGWDATRQPLLTGVFELGGNNAVEEVVVEWSNGERWIPKYAGMNRMNMVLENTLDSDGKLDNPEPLENKDFIDAKAFNPKSKTEATTRFVELSSEKTGITFSNIYREAGEYPPWLINSPSLFGGVATGDYDGDGLPDLFLTSPKGGHKLYRNLGGLKFEDQTEQAGIDPGSWSSGVAFADVDGDGHLDLYLCNYYEPNQLYLNNGDGTFREGAKAAGLDHRGASLMMAFADYDNDGDLDGYLLTNREYLARYSKEEVVTEDGRGNMWIHPRHRSHFAIRSFGVTEGLLNNDHAGEKDRLFRNNGDGTFSDVSIWSGIAGYDVTLSASWFDYNEDGLLDLYVANDYAGKDHLYHNEGDGTFKDVSPFILPQTPWFSMGTDSADLNNDGHLDLLTTDMAATTHYKEKVTMGDMGDRIVYVANQKPPQIMRNAVLISSGRGHFMEAGFLTGMASTDWTWSVIAGDFDNDGWRDVFYTNGMTRNWNDSDLRIGVAKSKDESLRLYEEEWKPQPVLKETNLAYRNLKDLKFKEMGKEWGLDHFGVSSGVSFCDFDRDGNLDAVVNHWEEPVSFYENTGKKGNSVLISLRGSMSNPFGLGARVELSGDAWTLVDELTSAHGFISSGEPVLHFGLGNAETVEKLRVFWPSGTQQEFTNLKVGFHYTISESRERERSDSNVEKKPMFVEVNLLKVGQHKEVSYNDFARQPLLPNKLSQLGPGLAWGDADGDGDDDLYIGGAEGQFGKLYVNFGRKGFLPTEIRLNPADKDCEDMGAVWFDSDSDGDLDLYVVSGGVQCSEGDSVLRDRLYINEKPGQFRIASEDALPSNSDSGSIVAACDFDRDGDVDLFVGGRSVPGKYPMVPKSRLLENKGGKFVDVTKQRALGLIEAGMVTGAVWSDIDNDAWLDLLVTYEWGPVGVYRNREGKLEKMEDAIEPNNPHGWWTGISSGDLDNDGDIDFVVTNFGLNTKYHPSADHPVELYYGRFAGIDEMRLVEAKYVGDQLYPIRGRSCSSRAMPELAEKFKTFRAFAAASLGDIYTEACLENSLRLYVDTLDTGVLINGGDGRFVFRELPHLAQISPAFGSSVVDVDGDGNLDIYLAQNFYGPQLETGLMAGGLSLLLRGNGDGSFVPVPPEKSGLLVAGDAKSLGSLDINHDGWVDFLVGMNNGKPRSFLNMGNKDGKVIKFRLIGKKGNPSAIGARLTVELVNGKMLIAERTAGCGYLSQSQSELLVGVGEFAIKNAYVRWPTGKTILYPNPPDQLVLTLREK